MRYARRPAGSMQLSRSSFRPSLIAPIIGLTKAGDTAVAGTNCSGGEVIEIASGASTVRSGRDKCPSHSS